MSKFIEIENDHIHFRPKYEDKDVHHLPLQLSNNYSNTDWLIENQINKIQETYCLQKVYIIYNKKVQQFFRKPKIATPDSNKATIFSRRAHAVYFANRLNLQNTDWEVYEVSVYGFDLE
jgi:hypothetical protein